MSWPVGAAGVALATYVGICLFMFLSQRQLMYHPDSEPLSAERAGPDWRIVTTETADGLRLTHLHRPAEAGQPTLLFFHGNAGHAGHRVGKLTFLAETGVGIFLSEYRGFGGNPGTPTEEGLFADARASLAWLASQGIAGPELILYGESLGSGVATAMASELADAGAPAAGLILEAPFTSMADAAQFHYPILPARWLVRDRYDSLALIARIATPLMILHGQEDRTVPFALGRRLYEAAVQPKTLVALPSTGHVGHFERPEAVQALRDFVTPAGEAVNEPETFATP
ncbi:alpha/beta hydrolase [Algihabitans albus]|uniref:alpha/beta hydrolase n=1 Tax=Algihabitans albus TaxID=2164067 RepID=UPI000E5D2367|nr:alpha/beta hydrolase [Algihabitans albus]